MFLHNSVLYILNCSSLPDASGSPPGSAAIGGKFFYDIDGKVPFSYYERKPELYDLDGKHRFDLFRVSLLYQIARQESEEGDTLETAYKVTANKTTGLFRVRGLFDTRLISVVGGPISKPFDMVRVNTGRFGFVYHNP